MTCTPQLRAERGARVQSQLQALACTEDGAFAASGAVRDPTVAIYNLSKSENAKLRTRKAAGHVQLSHAPMRLECYAHSDAASGSRGFLLLAVTNAGTAELWRCAKAGKRMETSQLCSVSASQSAAGTHNGIFTARLEGARSALPDVLAAVIFARLLTHVQEQIRVVQVHLKACSL